MPRYRFHIFNHEHVTDQVGSDFADQAAARTYAIKCAREIMAEELRTCGSIDLKHWIEIEDESGDMHVVAFGDVVTVNS